MNYLKSKYTWAVAVVVVLLFAGPQAFASAGTTWHSDTGKTIFVPKGKRLVMVPQHWKTGHIRLVQSGAKNPQAGSAVTWDPSCDPWVGRDLTFSPGPGPVPPRCEPFIERCGESAPPFYCSE
jgi:hypothetical protein